MASFVLSDDWDMPPHGFRYCGWGIQKKCHTEFLVWQSHLCCRCTISAVNNTTYPHRIFPHRLHNFPKAASENAAADVPSMHTRPKYICAKILPAFAEAAELTMHLLCSCSCPISDNRRSLLSKPRKFFQTDTPLHRRETCPIRTSSVQLTAHVPGCRCTIPDAHASTRCLKTPSPAQTTSRNKVPCHEVCVPIPLFRVSTFCG